MENQDPTLIDTSSQQFSPVDFLKLCLGKWKWFLFSLVAFCIIGYFFIKCQEPQYRSTASVLIKEEYKGNQLNDVASAFSSMGLFNTSVSVNNELIAFTSPSIMYEVVKRLNLTTNYERPGTFHPTRLYGTSLPVELIFHSLDEEDNASLKMRVTPDGKAVLYDFVRYTPDGEVKTEREITCSTNMNRVRTPLGDITVRRNAKYTGRVEKPTEIEVWHQPLQPTVDQYCSAVKGSLHDKMADVIDLKAISVSPELATDVLKMMIEVYNEKWVEDKNTIARATSSFINDRLMVIEQDLGNVDADISSFKSAHLVPDVKETSKMYMEKAGKNEEQALELNNRLSVAQYMRDYLRNPNNANSVLPSNTGIGDMDLESQVSEYNRFLLERNNIANNSSAHNPLVKDYDASLRGLRHAILQSVDNAIVSLRTSLRAAENAEGEARSAIASNPTQAKYLISVERQQKVKESLYLFLLEKREENELQQTFNSYNTRIITPPTQPLHPFSPRKGLIMLVAAFIGLLVPATALYMSMTLDTKVRNSKDIESLPIPFAGEIPAEEESRRKKLLNVKKEKSDRTKPVVEHGNRNAINEAFRVVRSNLDFMGALEPGHNVMMLTSYFPGSGKSFISLNLAQTYAIKGKSVLLIDGDLRHGSASECVHSPETGITSYLAGKTDDWHHLTIKFNGNDKFRVLPIGHRAPNPAELLENGLFKKMVEEAKKEFDIVIIDCPPDTIVADPQLIANVADRTLFVIRAGKMDKSLLSEVMRLYQTKKYRNLSIVINDVKQRVHSRYGYYSSAYYYYSK